VDEPALDSEELCKGVHVAVAARCAIPTGQLPQFDTTLESCDASGKVTDHCCARELAPSAIIDLS